MSVVTSGLATANWTARLAAGAHQGQVGVVKTFTWTGRRSVDNCSAASSERVSGAPETQVAAVISEPNSWPSGNPRKRTAPWRRR